MKKSILLFVFNTFLIGANFSQIPDSVTIAGKIEGYSKFSEHQFVRVAVNDLVVDDQIMYVYLVGQDGTFHSKVWIESPQTILFIYANQHVTLFAKPGDSIFLSFPAFAFISKNLDTLSEDFTKFSGDEQEMNRLLSKYIAYSVDNRREFYATLIGEKEAYKRHCKKHRQARQTLLRQFILEEKDAPDSFKQWAKLGIDYDYGNDLLLYWFGHSKDTFPDDWFDFINELPLDPQGASMSTSYKYYLHHLGMFMNRRFYNKEPIASMWKNKENFTGILMDSIVHNSTGYARDLFLTHLFGSSAGHPVSREWHMPFLPRFIEEVKDERCRAHIQKVYGLSEESAIPIHSLEELERSGIPDSIKEVLPMLLEKHKGKVIVLDFWATWCSPCLGELKMFYPEFVPRFKKDEVVFIFLASTSHKDTWQRMVSELQFEGEHILLTNNQYVVLQNLFQISGIPHHVLIDREGEVVENKADLLEGSIRNLLE